MFELNVRGHGQRGKKGERKSGRNKTECGFTSRAPAFSPPPNVRPMSHDSGVALPAFAWQTDSDCCRSGGRACVGLWRPPFSPISFVFPRLVFLSLPLWPVLHWTAVHCSARLCTQYILGCMCVCLCICAVCVTLPLGGKSSLGVGRRAGAGSGAGGGRPACPRSRTVRTGGRTTERTHARQCSAVHSSEVQTDESRREKARPTGHVCVCV